LYALDPNASSVKEIDLEEAKDIHIKPKFYNDEKIEQLISSKVHLNAFLVKYFGEPKAANVRHFNETFSIPGFLKEDNEQLLSLELIQAGYKLLVNIQWNRGKSKMRDFFTLSSSLRRTALMSMIIMLGDFGPAIIDSPEIHFDNEDIANYFVPLIKRFKDFQQVILFTNNPLLAVNTDPDNYILLETKGIKFKNIISGFAIDDKQRKQQLLNLMEGSSASFQKRMVRYESI